MRSLLPLTLLALLACEPDKDDTASYIDADGDGYDQSEDCDDTNAQVHPDAIEECDGIDNDCDGEIDGAEATGGPNWFADTDGDGHGDADNQIRACEQPSGYVGNDSDCDDEHADAFPGADEYCDGYDNDCDGETDEDRAVDASIWYDDNDGDGYGYTNQSVEACNAPDGYVSEPGDCDDADASSHPGAKELCDGADNDCDDEIDEADATDASTWYADDDDDAYGDAKDSTTACTRPDGYTDNAEDCDDSDPDINPSRHEECDGIDNDCDGSTDGADAIDATTWYADADSDGFGDGDDSQDACEQPSGYTDNGLDCADGDADINPDADEVCDGVDNDCKSYTSEDGVVTLDGTDNYPGIQSAVNDASSGSTVMVCDGTYTTTIDVDVDVTITSLNGATSTEIDADHRGAAFYIEDGAVTIDGFTITGGAGEDNPYDPTESVGGAIFVESTDAVVISNCEISDNDADFGGAIYLDAYAQVTISDTVIENNDAASSGGGLYADAATLHLDDVTLTGNDGLYGGGLLLIDTTATMDTVELSDNEASWGGGLLLSGGSLAGTDVVADGNTASDIGGGVTIIEGGELSGIEATDNEAAFGGGFALWGTDDDPTMSDCTVSRNTASTAGGGIWMYSTNVGITVSSTEISGNSAAYGGGLSTEGGENELDSCSVTLNSAVLAGGGAYVYDGTLASTSTDWGTATGADDNSPDDVYAATSETSYDAYGSSETFSCDNEECL